MLVTIYGGSGGGRCGAERGGSKGQSCYSVKPWPCVGVSDENRFPSQAPNSHFSRIFQRINHLLYFFICYIQNNAMRIYIWVIHNWIRVITNKLRRGKFLLKFKFLLNTRSIQFNIFNTY